MPTSTVDALARGRQTMLVRANQLLGTEDEDAAVAERRDAVPALAGLLMSSLEELKVAEEELREQNIALAERRAADERRLQHYQHLFQYIPSPVVITDLYASIVEVNLAAMDLFRREGRHLDRKPLAALLDNSSRAEFRKQLAHVVATRDTRSCRLTLNRVGDLPIEVTATVSVVPELGPTSSGMLFWLIERPAEDR